MVMMKTTRRRFHDCSVSDDLDGEFDGDGKSHQSALPPPWLSFRLLPGTEEAEEEAEAFNMEASFRVLGVSGLGMPSAPSTQTLQLRA